jgi:tRNA-dependent cyclodipeptide synthase
MKIYKIRGGTQTEVKAGKYLLHVGVSLGNKWFTPEKTAELIAWALPLSRGQLVVNVVDLIHAINLEVGDRLDHVTALARAKDMGANFLAAVRAEVETRVPLEQRAKILYTDWGDVSTPEFKEKVGKVRVIYQTDTEFRDTIHRMVRQYTSRKAMGYTDSDIDRLGEYIVEELPELLCRVPIGGVVCDGYVYPFDGDVTRMVERIQKGEAFPEIRAQVLDTEPKIFIEAR